MRNLPHYAFEHNQTWLEVSLIAQDLLAWTRLLCLTGELAKAEPKRLRQRLLDVAAKLVRHGRRTQLKLDIDWPWSKALAAAFKRLRAISALCERRREPAHDPDDHLAAPASFACSTLVSPGVEPNQAGGGSKTPYSPNLNN